MHLCNVDNISINCHHHQCQHYLIIITCFCAFHSCRMEKATQMIPERQYRPLDQQSARRYFVKFNPGTEHDQILNCLREHNSVQLWVAQTFSFASTRWTAPWPDFTYLASFAFAGEVLVLEYLLPEALVHYIFEFELLVNLLPYKASHSAASSEF